MKSTIVLLTIMLLPLIGLSQTKTGNEKIMKKFVKYYNNNQADSICKLFDYDDINKMWNSEEINALQKSMAK